MQPAAPGHVAQASRGRRTREKRTLSGPRSWFLGMGKRLVWLRRPHVAQAAADREMTKWLQMKSAGAGGAPSHSGICAAWPRQLAARRVWRKTKHWQPAFLAFWDGKAPCLAAPVPCRAGSYEPGNDKNGRKRKARAQEGPRPAAGCARLGRGSLPPKQPPVKAADFSFTAGNLAEALNPFFIFDKIQEGKSKHRPLSCKHN